VGARDGVSPSPPPPPPSHVVEGGALPCSVMITAPLKVPERLGPRRVGGGLLSISRSIGMERYCGRAC